MTTFKSAFLVDTVMNFFVQFWALSTRSWAIHVTKPLWLQKQGLPLQFQCGHVTSWLLHFTLLQRRASQSSSVFFSHLKLAVTARRRKNHQRLNRCGILVAFCPEILGALREDAEAKAFKRLGEGEGADAEEEGEFWGFFFLLLKTK